MKIDKSLLSGSTTLLVLSLLRGGDMYGYEMISELSRRSDRTFELKEGTLYPILHGLEQDKCVSAYEKEAPTGRKRKYYHITRRGLELLEQNMMTANEKFNLMVASQDYPDIISGFDESYSGGAVKGYEDDVIIDLTDLMDENAPNYMAYIQQDQQNYRDAYNDDGQMLFMNGYNDYYVLARGNVIRQDLLDKLGLDADEIINMKMTQNEAKYSVDKAKGNAVKYDQL